MKRLAAIAALAALVPAGALAYSISMTPYGNVVRWDHADLTYYLDPNGAPGAGTAAIQEMHDSFTDWAAVSCTALSFKYLGATSNKSVVPISGQTNGKNELVFINNSAWDFGQQVLGVTSPVYNYSGEIHEADIAFNGYFYEWNTEGKIGMWGNTMDVKSVAIHEIGHFFGVQHVLYGYNEWDPPTMAPAVDPNGNSATLHADDQKAVCFLYPANGYFTCGGDADCPKIVDDDYSGNEKYTGQLKCQGGYCSGVAGISPGSVAFGGVCQKASDCQSPDTCQTLDAGSTICTHSCDTANDTCPANYYCNVLVRSGKAACVPGNKKGGEGEPCKYSSDCATSYCTLNPDKKAMYCRVPCKKDGPACADGKVCYVAGFGTVGGCLDPSLIPVEKKPLGSECGFDAECKSDLCFSLPGEVARCRQACDPSAPACYGGYWCYDLGGGRGACLDGEPPVPLTKTGEACGANEECETGWCVNLLGTDESYCRTSCNLDDWACVWGTVCVSYGTSEYGVCMPSLGRLDVGAACQGRDDCITALCWAAPDEGQAYCTQSCFEEWCPEPMICTGDATLGRVCRMPDGTEPEVVEKPPMPEEEGVPEEEGEGAEETPVGPPSKKGSCTAGAAGGAPVPFLLIPLLGLARRRVRTP
ncbi:MAG: matrixin family metalloprotease [Deltaproteobacteria bacterium]|nr:matrixin family metalloprotease [Deltaproteobacteria bacterium]